MLKLMIVLSTLILSLQAQAHPVSYKDAFSLMSYNMAEANEMLLTYSWSAQSAIAMTYLRQEKSEIYIPRGNFLLKRWNNDDSQGNIYLSAGYGAEKFNSKNYGVGLGEIILDWESRRYLSSFEYQHFFRQNEDNSFLAAKDLGKAKARLGFAPFLADYKDLNVWYIAEFNHQNEISAVQTFQFLRFYIRNVLWEVGADFNGSFAFNFMLHL